MAWNGNNDSNQTAYKNYMYNNKIFILDEITSTNCAFLIGDLTQFVCEENNAQEPKKLSIFINSPGGEVNVMMTILGLLNLARLNNIEIITYVLGLAGSAASIIAAQGDYRVMSNISKHLIHFGTIFDVTSKHSEIEKVYQQNKEYAENMQDLYLKACKGKLSRQTLLALQGDERGYLNAEQCLKYGLCDCILETELDKKTAEEEKIENYQKEFKVFLNKKKETSSKKSTKKVK